MNTLYGRSSVGALLQGRAFTKEGRPRRDARTSAGSIESIQEMVAQCDLAVEEKSLGSCVL